jgi:hypothetical protein
MRRAWPVPNIILYVRKYKGIYVTKLLVNIPRPDIKPPMTPIFRDPYKSIKIEAGKQNKHSSPNADEPIHA